MNKTLLQSLEELVAEASVTPASYLSAEYVELIRYIVRYERNRAPVRFLLSCCAAKIDRPGVDIRKPYTEISKGDSFSGRNYDETYIQHIVDTHELPVNATTAYLTPAFRNRNSVMVPGLKLVGRPEELYAAALKILGAVYDGDFSAPLLFQEIIYQLFLLKREKDERMRQLIENLKGAQESLALSSEQIVTLIDQHLKSKNASRLPVLVVAAAYQAVQDLIGEAASPLNAHNAADKQTGALGDVEITLTGDDGIVTSYEMKAKRIMKADITVALSKIAGYSGAIDNYIFITTDVIEDEVLEYARSQYDTLGVEIMILDCLGFLRHFLHFFHRRRTVFLDEYQRLVLSEPTSAVSQPLKEAFLALRSVAESDN